MQDFSPSGSIRDDLLEQDAQAQVLWESAKLTWKGIRWDLRFIFQVRQGRATSCSVSDTRREGCPKVGANLIKVPRIHIVLFLPPSKDIVVSLLILTNSTSIFRVSSKWMGNSFLGMFLILVPLFIRVLYAHFKRGCLYCGSQENPSSIFGRPFRSPIAFPWRDIWK